MQEEKKKRERQSPTQSLCQKPVDIDHSGGEEHKGQRTVDRHTRKYTCQNIPRWDKGRKTATTEEVDAHVSRTEGCALVSVQWVKLGAHPREKEDEAMAKHPGYAQVQDLWQVERHAETTWQPHKRNEQRAEKRTLSTPRQWGTQWQPHDQIKQQSGRGKRT